MSPRTARVAIVALLGLVTAAVAFATLRGPAPNSTGTGTGGEAVASAERRLPAPDLVAPAGFLNSGPLTLAELRGRVVLVDFWTYSCINCQRTFPSLRAWWDRYRSDGLVILGVHSPEFDFEKDPSNVADAVRRYGVAWPVVLDPEMATWSAYSNRYWPAEYLIDRQGRLARVHFGEGEYLETERAIRQLLAEGGHPVAPVDPSSTEPPNPFRDDETPETYAGYQRGELANEGGYVRDRPSGYSLPARPGGLALGGPWLARLESVDAAGPGAELVLPFAARLVHVVASGPADVVVTLDGAPVPPDQRPPGMSVRPDGATVVRIAGPDLYTVAAGAAFRRGVLGLRPEGTPFSVFSFTFGA